MDILFAIFGSVFAIFVAISLHEWGHFIVARMCGVTVERFSIGFGRPILKRTGRHGTEYTIGLFPLGGFVKMKGDELDENEKIPSSAGSYLAKPVWARMLIVLAGPFMNFVLAAIVFALMYMIGISYVKPIVGEVVPGGIADQAGIVAGDQILKVAKLPVKNWQNVALYSAMNIGSSKPIPFEVSRSNQRSAHYLDLSQWRLEGREPNLLLDMGMVPVRPPMSTEVSKVLSGSPAEAAGLQSGDRILRVNNHPVSDWYALIKQVRALPEKTVQVQVRRGQQVINKTVVIGTHSEGGQTFGTLGVYGPEPDWPAGMKVEEQYGFFTSWSPAVVRVFELIRFNWHFLGKLLMGHVSFKAIGGPVMLFEFAGKATFYGLQVYLGLLAFISVSLGFINLLPIPGLDGGHFMYYVLEVLRGGRPLSLKVQRFGLYIGFSCLIMLLVFVTVNDLIRLFS